MKMIMLATCAVLGLTCPAHAGGIAFTFDDGYESVDTIVRPLMDEYSIPGTAFISTGLLGDKGYLTEAELRQLAADPNWELGAHTINHGDLTLMSDQELERNLVEPLDYLRKFGQVVALASPFGYYNEHVLTEVAKHYDSHVNAWSDTNGINRWATLDLMNINRWTIRNTDTSEAVCKKMSKLADDEVFVIAIHDVTKVEPKLEREYDISEKTLRELIICSIEQKKLYFRIKDLVGAR